MRNVAFLYCRNEERFLGQVLDHVQDQTLPFSDIIVVNDASTDRTKEIAQDHGVILINLEDQHDSYVGKPELATIVNHVFDYITYDLPYCPDYMMQLGSDTLIPQNYNEEITKRMSQDQRIVIAGGIIKGEHQSKGFVRGSGRYFNYNYFRVHIQKYPLNYTWESYPLFYAWTLGLKVISYPDLIMITLRPTTNYKSVYGYAMKELGYFPPFAIGRCLQVLFKNNKPDKPLGVSMLLSYLRSPHDPKYREIKNYIRLHQVKRILNPFHIAQVLLRSRK